jgi:hypothetical protein
MRIAPRRATRLVWGALAAIVVLLILAQLVLPAIAARIARDQIGKYGAVRDVSVHAFPAIELLWGHAESATVRAGDLRLSDTQFDGLVPRMRGIETVDLSAESLQLGPLRMRDLRVHKHGEAIEAHATLTQAELQSALPVGVEVRVLQSTAAGVQVRVSGSLFGIGASALALLGAQEGKLVAQPQGFPLAGLARVTIFSDPRLYVQGFQLAESAPAGGGEPSYAVTLRATLR